MAFYMAFYMAKHQSNELSFRGERWRRENGRAGRLGTALDDVTINLHFVGRISQFSKIRIIYINKSSCKDISQNALNLDFSSIHYIEFKLN